MSKAAKENAASQKLKRKASKYQEKIIVGTFEKSNASSHKPRKTHQEIIFLY